MKFNIITFLHYILNFCNDSPFYLLKKCFIELSFKSEATQYISWRKRSLWNEIPFYLIRKTNLKKANNWKKRQAVNFCEPPIIKIANKIFLTSNFKARLWKHYVRIVTDHVIKSAKIILICKLLSYKTSQTYLVNIYSCCLIKHLEKQILL